MSPPGKCETSLGVGLVSTAPIEPRGAPSLARGNAEFFSVALDSRELKPPLRRVPFMDIYKVFTLEAAHRLPNLPPEHKCARLHGHSFRVEVHVNGDIGAESGWVMDFADIKAAFDPLFDRLDHRYLNEVAGLENPTSERLAVWIWERLKPTLPQLSEVVVHETCTSGCRYRG
jgi:6-pyruvoyltetrahydropterin/6-carboxytetrahydropterin synthase